MKYFKIKYNNDDFIIVKANNALEVIKRYDLATKEHINTRVTELEGEQRTIAISNEGGQ